MQWQALPSCDNDALPRASDARRRREIFNALNIKLLFAITRDGTSLAEDCATFNR